MDSALDPRRSSYGRDYWLRRCEGFEVSSPGGRVGKVKAILFAEQPEPQALPQMPVVRSPGRLRAGSLNSSSGP